MRPSIPTLIERVFAREALSDAELERLTRHVRSREAHDTRILKQQFPNYERGMMNGLDDFETYRRAQLQASRTASPAMLRQMLHEVLGAMEAVLEVTASRRGEARGQRREAGRRRAAQRRSDSAELLDIVKRRTANGASAADAIRWYLRDHDDDWSAASDEARARKVATVARRLRRARTSRT